MYLKVLQREGDFEPLSRVDILGRYLSESLRKPSDASTGSFNFKNRMDVLSSFAFKMHSERLGDFDERYWLDFCRAYQQRTLREFDEREFLNELIEARVFGTYRHGYFFRYSFYFVFFLGRYLWPRPSEMEAFFSSNDYLVTSGVIDVVTGLSSENSVIVTSLCDRLESRLDDFATKYVRTAFDPLADARWPSNENENEELWAPVQKAIEAGPADTSKIDELKTSLQAEAMTANQQIIFQDFTDLENALFVESSMLQDALKNADDVSGHVKIRAWKAVLRSALIVVQVGTMFAPALAKRKRFRFGSVSFLDFNRAAEGLDENSHEAFVSVIVSLVDAVASQTAREAGSIKLAPVFRAVASDTEVSGFMEVVNFGCILAARGKSWADTLTAIIEKTDKNAYYLRALFDLLMAALKYEILQGRDREATKRLVALIQAKRDFGSQLPGAKAVRKMFDHLEKTDYFPEPSSDSREADTKSDQSSAE